MSPTTNAATHFFTVDVEEYFQVQALESAVSRDAWLAHPSRINASIDALLAMLNRHSVRGTFFVLGWLGKYRPAVVRAIVGAGHEIASHGFSHQRVCTLHPEDFQEDVRAAKLTLENVTGQPVIGYRAPSFSIIPGCEWAFDVLIQQGYRYDSSIFPIRRRGYGYPSAPRAPYIMRRRDGVLAEFPLTTTTVFGLSLPAAGGGYLRQFPLGVIRRAFREAGERGESGTFYIHPWEIDPDQPRLRVSALNRIRHYRGLDQTLKRMEILLSEFHFGSIDSSLAQLMASTPGLQPVGAAS